ncbi:Protein of unknown function [Leuconostoc citreum LBAE C11]|nr:Protein of unknown function [Leuconostoc citreum LBAE C11]
MIKPDVTIVLIGFTRAW